MKTEQPTNHEVLLTVSGIIPPDLEDQIARGERPNVDYLALSRSFGADLLDYPKARERAGTIGRFLERIAGPNAMLAWSCFTGRNRYKVIVTDGEQVGIPLSLLFMFFGGQHRPQHFMIGHVLSVAKKTVFFDYFGIQDNVDLFFVYSTYQKEFIESRWRVPSKNVVLTPFMVDADFFSPEQVVPTTKLAALAAEELPIICAVGLEFRDYPTLMAAVRDLPVKVVIAAASPWSKREDTTEGEEIPDNVLVDQYTQYELRELYALSRFMVMPLFDVDFQAGVTAILEAMSMERAVICSRNPGQTDVIVDGETGLYVPPEDPAALREAIRYLLNNPKEARRMGRNGRRLVEQQLSLDCYSARLSSYVRKAVQDGAPSMTD